MLQGSELALDRAQIERTMNRKTAILAKGRLEGYNFIRLCLKNIRKRKISGIDILEATEFTNHEMGGVTDYHLELKGGTIDFEYHPEFGMYLFDMVDTEHNRDFLATHLEYKFWDIMDDKVLYDVRLRLEKIKKIILSQPKPDLKDGPAGFWDEVRKNEARQLALVRGEIPVDTTPTLQPTEEVKNTPDLPGYIPGQQKIKTPHSLAQPREGWKKGVKRGPKGKNMTPLAEQIRELKLKNEGLQAPESVGVGVTQP